MAIRPTPMNDNTGIVPPWLSGPKWAHTLIDNYATSRRQTFYDKTIFDGYEPTIPDDMVRIMQNREQIRTTYNYTTAKKELQNNR